MLKMTSLINQKVLKMVIDMYEIVMMINFHIPLLTELYNSMERDRSQFNTYLHTSKLIS